MRNFILLIAIIPLLSSCYPVIFGAASTASVSLSQHRSVSQNFDDHTIWTKITKEFLKQGFKDYFNKITVEVNEGRVLLIGFVKEQEHEIKAVEICWEQDGVIEVDSELKIDEQNSKGNPLRYAKDTWISSQVKSKALVNKSIKYVNYTIITFDNIVYLFGNARSEEELEKLADMASQVKGVEKVVIYVKIVNETHNTAKQDAAL